MGMFTGVQNAKGKRDGNYVKPGNYICRITRVKADKNRKGDEFVAVEMDCLHVAATEQGLPGHIVGEAVSHLLMKKSDYFLDEFRSFAAAAVGCGIDEIDEQACVDICDPELQPLAGSIVEIQAKNRITKQGKDFTNVTYKRRISAAAIKAKDAAMGGLLTDQEIARFFPKGSLEKQIALEAAEVAQAA